MFVLDTEDRITRENDSEGSPAPRLYFSGCPSGNVVRLHRDISPAIADEILSLVKQEPAWFDEEELPVCLPQIAKMLALERPVEIAATALAYELPVRSPFARITPIVSSETDEGVNLLLQLSRDGMPSHLKDAGFLGVGDFWSPWCAALDSGEIAAMAFAARLGREGAECGVYTFPGFRGRGLAAAVTAAWSAHPALSGRTLFYSTHVANPSSIAVTRRLGLRRLGVSVRLY